MNNYTEQQIEEKLKTLASLEPGAESVDRMNRQIRTQLANPKRSYPLTYSILSAAAVLLICLMLFDSRPIPGSIYPDTPKTAGMSLIELNTTFRNGGEKALDEHLNVYAKRDAQPETITLQELMKEL